MAHTNMLFYPLYYDIIISLTSLKMTQAFHLLFGFAEKLYFGILKFDIAFG